MCHAYHRRHARRTTTVALPDERGHVRASDAERERVVEALRAHAQAGRLTSDELEERVGAALAAASRDDLAALQRDLPGPPVTATPIAGRPREKHPVGFLPIAVLLVAIWALSGAGYFWPMWPLAWFAFASIMRTGHILVTGNTRRTW
jgi:hypothetical protein